MERSLCTSVFLRLCCLMLAASHAAYAYDVETFLPATYVVPDVYDGIAAPPAASGLFKEKTAPSVAYVYDEESCKFPALFAFGDSLTDTGNAQAVFPWQHAASLPPYGETYFGEPRDRFSDGRLLIDFFAQALGLPMLDPYLRSVGSNLKHGANFATSGATVTNITFLVPYDFGVQVYWLEQFHAKSAELQVQNDSTWEHPFPSASDFDKALYVISIGGNDYDAGVFYHNMSETDLRKLLPEVIAETMDYIRELYEAGARNLMIINVPPIGCSPELLTILPQGPPEYYDDFGCHIPFNSVLNTHNNQLKTGLEGLRDELPHAMITYVDYYQATYDISRDHESYNLQNLTHSCCGWGGKWNYNVNVSCSQTAVINGVQVTATVCPDPNVFLNWDGIHPTEAFFKIAARAFLMGKYVEPAHVFNACKFDFSRFDQVSESSGR